ncbi:MAG: hypothetical protein UY23_C0001G0308 [Candidatus Jorgensenbacteria bacterium GW2011_GWA1_48_11]|uniref:Uncharacterized protein n=1 Tax=Candidatus Jorgensenbacteria bacterium GW2011_GWA1_48_11 TaxID=1618660 RepID=A0A0G1UC54_9BACT|nr:MAG: hypothetical protein UY23_C0001G0308 [Candidatus Jorgensenbacteria bacterium GW2011_GWA1_48_11]KKW12193.1 MAG: hypothetical protein UY51_C0005G0435 [Candidatus Jorgensenbacteria bacterium GW2011_GWB1_49_9]
MVGVFCFMTGESDREKGRENGSFPVAEVLKPQGVKKFRGYGILSASPQVHGSKGEERRARLVVSRAEPFSLGPQKKRRSL